MESVASDDKSIVVILVAVSSRVGPMPSGGLQLWEEEQGGVVGGQVAGWVLFPGLVEGLVPDGILSTNLDSRLVPLGVSWLVSLSWPRSLKQPKRKLNMILETLKNLRKRNICKIQSRI